MQIFVGSEMVVARDWRPPAGRRGNVESKWWGKDTIPRGVSGRLEMGKGDSRNEGRRRMGIPASRTDPLNLNGLSNNVTYVSPLASRSSLNA